MAEYIAINSFNKLLVVEVTVQLRELRVDGKVSGYFREDRGFVARSSALLPVGKPRLIGCTVVKSDVKSGDELFCGSCHS